MGTKNPEQDSQRETLMDRYERAEMEGDEVKRRLNAAIEKVRKAEEAKKVKPNEAKWFLVAEEPEETPAEEDSGFPLRSPRKEIVELIEASAEILAATDVTQKQTFAKQALASARVLVEHFISNPVNSRVYKDDLGHVSSRNRELAMKAGTFMTTARVRINQEEHSRLRKSRV